MLKKTSEWDEINIKILDVKIKRDLVYGEIVKRDSEMQELEKDI